VKYGEGVLMALVGEAIKDVSDVMKSFDSKMRR
jgi:hypothetical protein